MEQEIRTFIISREGAKAAARREAQLKIYIAFGVTGALGLFLLCTVPAGFWGIALIPFVVGGFIGLMLYTVTADQIANRLEATRFQIANDHIARGLDTGALDGLSKFGMEVARARYHQASYNQFILLAHLDCIDIKKNGIDITAKDYNPFTAEGRIFIPKETDGYEAIVQLFSSDPKKYRVRISP